MKKLLLIVLALIVLVVGFFVWHRDSAEEEGHVVETHDVTFERGSGTARFKFFWRNGAWDVLGFDLHTGP